MTRTDTEQSGAPKKSRKKIIAIVAAAALMVGGAVAAVIAKQSYDAETLAICETAASGHAKAVKSAQAAVQAADEALEAVKSTALPDGAGTSADYASRTGAAELIESAAGPRDALKELAAEQVADCETRDDATGIDSSTEKMTDGSTSLDEAVLALADDFAVFQAEEAERIAAEKKAAEEAAAAAAAEAERLAAEQAAADQAAQDSWSGGYDGGYSDPGYSGGGGGGSNPGGGGGGMIAPPPGQSGGGCPPGTTAHVTNDGGTVSCW